MYFGNVVMMIGIPLALGSYWGLLFVIPGLAVLAIRILDEEKVLHTGLTGYRRLRAEGALPTGALRLVSERRDRNMKIVLQMMAASLFGLVFFGVLLFLPAGSFDYWQAWVFIAVFAVVRSRPCTGSE